MSHFHCASTAASKYFVAIVDPINGHAPIQCGSDKVNIILCKLTSCHNTLTLLLPTVGIVFQNVCAESAYILHPIVITARKQSLGQGNIFSSVCREFCSQGGSASVHAGIPPPPPGTRQPPPPGADPPGTRHPRQQTPPGSRHPPVQCMLRDTVNKRAVCILLECNLVQHASNRPQNSQTQAFMAPILYPAKCNFCAAPTSVTTNADTNN